MGDRPLDKHWWHAHPHLSIGDAVYIGRERLYVDEIETPQGSSFPVYVMSAVDPPFQAVRIPHETWAWLVVIAEVAAISDE